MIDSQEFNFTPHFTMFLSDVKTCLSLASDWMTHLLPFEPSNLDSYLFYVCKYPYIFIINIQNSSQKLLIKVCSFVNHIVKLGIITIQKQSFLISFKISILLNNIWYNLNDILGICGYHLIFPSAGFPEVL